MGVLILLIVVDLLVIGTVMYFVFSEKEQKHEHYVPVQQAEARDWAVQTTSDAEVKGASAEKALTGGNLTTSTSRHYRQTPIQSRWAKPPKRPVKKLKN